MILVFAGAGASAAVNNKDYPTTIEFYNQLGANIKNNISSVLGGSLINYIDINHHSEKNIMDIEQLLWYISKLKEDFEPMFNEKIITGKIMRDSVHRHFYDFCKSSTNELSVLEDQIYREIYRLYSKRPSRDDLNVWIELITNLQKIGHPIEIFTTNYDLVLESVIGERNIKIQTEYYLGSERTLIHKTDNLKNWIRKANISGRLTKLHGSVNWKRIENEILIGDKFFTGDHKNHAIIYPGYKGEPEDKFFKKLHEHFEAMLREARVTIFIGFSFRDDYINRKIIELTPEKQLRIVISKGKLENRIHPDFPYDHKNSKHFDKGFTEESVTYILNQCRTMIF